jgi:hypothetical protein
MSFWVSAGRAEKRDWLKPKPAKLTNAPNKKTAMNSQRHRFWKNRDDRVGVAPFSTEDVPPAPLALNAAGAVELGPTGRVLLLKTASRFMNKP